MTIERIVIVPANCGCSEWRNGIQRFTRYEQDTEIRITEDVDGYLWGYLATDDTVRVRIAPVLYNKLREVNND